MLSSGHPFGSTLTIGLFNVNVIDLAYDKQCEVIMIKGELTLWNTGIPTLIQF